MRRSDVIFAPPDDLGANISGKPHCIDKIAQFLRQRGHDAEPVDLHEPVDGHSTACNFATANASHFSPWRLKRTCAFASVPAPSSAITVPSPNLLWNTGWPILNPVSAARWLLANAANGLPASGSV